MSLRRKYQIFGPNLVPGSRPFRARSRTVRSITAVLAAGVNPNAQLAFKEPSRGGRDNRLSDDLLTTGATPLIRAAQTFDNEVVRLLLTHGARADVRDDAGRTPSTVARSKEIAALLPPAGGASR